MLMVALEDAEVLGVLAVEPHAHRANTMNGVDAIIYTAGVGENSASTRKAISGYFGYLGVEIDDEANKKRGEDIVISTPASRVKVMMVSGYWKEQTLLYLKALRNRGCRRS